jgi:DEAD/DEAH box helicase domain-containing protein
MPIKIYRSRDFDHTHERILFDEICKKLFKEYYFKEENYLFIANLHVGGRELDGLLIKKDAITIIEFKNFGGYVEFYENGDWPITSFENGTSNTNFVKGGNSENPYQQVRQNKFSLLNILNDFAKFNNAELGHISGIVLFSKDIEYDFNRIPSKISSWFHITDLEDFIQKFNQITSTKISISNSEINDLVRIFNLKPFQEILINDKLKRELNISDDIIVKEVEIEKEPLQNESIKTKENSLTEPLDLNVINEIGYSVIHSDILPSRERKIRNASELNLSTSTLDYLKEDVNNEIYFHQYEAIDLINQDKNVCISTSTSSGKSLIFYTSALENLAKNPLAKIIAIYPLRALAFQQEEKWNDAVKKSNLNIKVGRIDGTIDSSLRKKVLKTSNIICVTPDIIHSWFLSQIDNKEIQTFIRNISLIIIDEVHVYRGVFGSNAAYLFRRLNFANEQLRLKETKPPQFLCASATINNTELLLDNLLGLPFEIIDHTYETSPKHEIEVFLLDPKEEYDPYSKIAELISHFTQSESNRSISFVDNRKAVEQIATITDRLVKDQIYPYRSGYESEDRNFIQTNLQNGNLKGVISTSALEMGIDIGHLNIGILYGVPSSQTSFMQRIGRVGRHQPGKIFIINDNSIRSERIFKNPTNIFNIPPADTALYLENEYIQYIHALCLVGMGGYSEFDNLKLNISKLEESEVKFSSHFLELCGKVKSAIEPSYLKMLNQNSNEDPHYTYPLRDIEKQFKIELSEGREIVSLGEMTKSQQMREAYPGAVYYHMMKSYRVRNIKGSKIELSNEMKYTTRPSLQIAPFPNIENGLIDKKAFGSIKFIECNLDVYENIFGYYEKKGGSDEINITYPNKYYSKKCYSRRIVTTGVVIGGAILNNISSPEKKNAIANIFYNVFISSLPYENQDVDSCLGTFNKLNAGNYFNAEDSYICIYDKTYGSLRLTSKLMYQDTLLKSVNYALDWLTTAESVYTKDGEEINIDSEIVSFFKNFKNELLNPEQDFAAINTQSEINETTITVLSINQNVKLLESNEIYKIDWVYPSEYSTSINITILYDLINITSGEEKTGVHEGEIIIDKSLQTSQYDLIKKRIL